MSQGQGWSYGKCIITGEHSVVYGAKAIAVPLPLQVTVTLRSDSDVIPTQVTDPFLLHLNQVAVSVFSPNENHQLLSASVTTDIDSQLPQNAGFGSSAALAKAYLTAYGQLCHQELSDNALFQAVQESEQFAHGRPSGIDAAVVVYNRPVLVQKQASGLAIEPQPEHWFPLDQCIVLHSGSAQESTKTMVTLSGTHAKAAALTKAIGAITEALVADLDAGRIAWDWMTENQRYLEEWGLVGQKARSMIRLIEKSGGQAKVSGAGGVKTGSGAILVYHPDPELLLAMAQKHAWPVLFIGSKVVANLGKTETGINYLEAAT